EPVRRRDEGHAAEHDACHPSTSSVRNARYGTTRRPSARNDRYGIGMPTRPPARDRLLDAAESVLFSHGIRATPVDELLRQAEVSPATMYAHFGSKDALVAQALRRRLAD